MTVTLWMLPSLIAYSNGVDESWKAGIGHGIRWLNPKLSQSAIVPQFIGSVFCSHFGICWLAVCLFDVHRSAFFPSFVHCPFSPAASLFSGSRVPLGHVFTLQLRNPLRKTVKKKSKHCIIRSHSWSTTALAHIVLYPS